MFIKLNRKSRAQTTAEYAILIGLVIAAVVAMQIYVKRGLQARTHDVGVVLGKMTNALDSDSTHPLNQYEPYYLNSSFDVNRTTLGNAVYNRGDFNASENAYINRERGYQIYQFDKSVDTNK